VHHPLTQLCLLVCFVFPIGLETKEYMLHAKIQEKLMQLAAYEARSVKTISLIVCDCAFVYVEQLHRNNGCVHVCCKLATVNITVGVGELLCIITLCWFNPFPADVANKRQQGSVPMSPCNRTG
jgi:hypothetical protein